MRARTIVLAAAGLAMIAVSVWPRAEGGPAAFVDPPTSIEIFYTPPVLVRAGREVRIPADAVCTTAQGNPCSANVTLGTQVGTGPWQTTTRPARPGLEFDVTDVAAHAVREGTQSVRFFLRAQNDAGITTSFGTPQAPLRFWVVASMADVKLPTIPFGRVRTPASALFLPWGSGPMKAGLSLGRESLTVGPSAFDVDESGRIYLLDTEQDRLAVFSGGKLDRQTPIHLVSEGDVAVGADGTVHVLDVTNGVARVRAIAPSGTGGMPLPAGGALSSHLRVAGTAAFANLLPMDAWVRVPSSPDALPGSPSEELSVGRPIAGGDQLLRVGTSRAVRLARVSGETLSSAVEIQSDASLGEVALAEPDGTGGYWCVVRVWREEPTPADQYQVVRVKGGKVLQSFAVGSQQYADTPPLSRFRLGRDGDLYQMTTSADGVRILRFDVGGEA